MLFAAIENNHRCLNVHLTLLKAGDSMKAEILGV